MFQPVPSHLGTLFLFLIVSFPVVPFFPLVFLLHHFLKLTWSHPPPYERLVLWGFACLVVLFGCFYCLLPSMPPDLAGLNALLLYCLGLCLFQVAGLLSLLRVGLVSINSLPYHLVAPHTRYHIDTAPGLFPVMTMLGKGRVHGIHSFCYTVACRCAVTVEIVPNTLSLPYCFHLCLYLVLPVSFNSVGYFLPPLSAACTSHQMFPVLLSGWFPSFSCLFC